MKKNILITILLLSLLVVPLASQADTPLYIEDGGGSGGGGGGTGGGTTTTNTTNAYSKPKLSVYTDKATNISYTSAVLNGHGGINITYNEGCNSFAGYSTTTNRLCSEGVNASSTQTYPLTAYFRYSKSSISPIFCNDIYGTNMIATKDIKLGIVNSASFSQKITSLAPDTTYYYCAIISDKVSIAYGGSDIVKTFHTSPYSTTVKTKSATDVASTSAKLNASYSSKEDVSIYFQYKKFNSEMSVNWEETSKKNFNIGSYANIFEDNLSINLTKLIPNTRYQFRAVAEGIEKKEDSKTVYGNIFGFTTNESGGDDDNNGEKSCEEQGTCITYTPTFCELNPTNPSCIYITSPKCFPPQVLNTSTNLCQSPLISCGYPTVYDFLSGSCVNPPTNNFCQAHPTDALCASGNRSTNTGTTGTSTTGIGGNVGTSGNTGISGTGTSGNTGIGGTGTSGTGTGGTGTSGFYNIYGTGGYTTGGNGSSNNNSNNSIINTPTLVLGQTATPPSDAIVRYHEGIETVFVRQIMNDLNFAKLYGYQEGTDLQTFAWTLADSLARVFGYIDLNGKEIRVSFPDIAAYQLQFNNNLLTVYEYYDNKIVDVRNITAVFKNASYYEYYYRK